MSGLYAIGATLLSVVALALVILQLGGKVRLSLEAAAAGAALGATISLLFAPFDLLANPMRFAPQTLAFGCAGLPEEALKMLGFAAFLRPHWRARSPRDVMLAAGALALGFAALETLPYVIRDGEGRVREAVTAAPMQVLWGIAGGYVVARAPANARGVAMGVAAWLGLAALHGVYDFGYFAGKPDAVRFVAFDALIASLGLDASMTLRVLVDGAAAASALAAAAALRALPPAPSAIGFGGALAATLIAGAFATALYGAGEAYAADAWLPFATGLGFALPPFALGVMSRPEGAAFSRRQLATAAALAVCAASVATGVWGPAGWRRLDVTRAQSQGAQLYAQRDFERAAGAYGRAVEIMPGNAEPLAQRAAANAAARRYGDALADLDAALTFDAANPQWLAQRAQARLETGDSDGAALDLAQARRLAPNDPGIMRMTALRDVDKGDWDAALRQLNARLHDDPGDRLATFQRGRVWFYKGEYARARDDFAAILVADPALYSALWHALAQRLLHESAGDALKARLDGAPPAWPSPVARMLLAAGPRNDARALAANDEERCQADFYFALSRLGVDPSDLTAERLHAVPGECPTRVIEFEGAKAELRRLAR